MSRTRGSEFPLSWRLCTICSRARASADLLAMRLWASEVTGSPCLRCDPDLLFRSAEQPEARPAAARGVGKGTLWVGPPATSLLPSPLVVLHGSGDVHSRMLLTDTPPERTGATLYPCRDWIEQNLHGPGAPAGRGSARVRTGPVRAGRHWLVMVLTALLAVAYGTRWEEAATLGRTPAQFRTPQATVPSLPVPGTTASYARAWPVWEPC
ncbi:MAG: hypothetical protein OXH72_07870 [Caldilineaceae bacterium]|nr:hypothetical protein [Caldilineaceae bacterium]